MAGRIPNKVVGSGGVLRSAGDVAEGGGGVVSNLGTCAMYCCGAVPGPGACALVWSKILAGGRDDELGSVRMTNAAAALPRP